MFSAYDLGGVSSYLEARRSRDIPVVSAPSNGEVTKVGRVVLRASIYKALAIVIFDCIQGHSSRTPKPGVRNLREFWGVGADEHDFVMRRAEGPEVVMVLIGHDGGILVAGPFLVNQV
jgi:hypothetical protein